MSDGRRKFSQTLFCRRGARQHCVAILLLTISCIVPQSQSAPNSHGLPEGGLFSYGKLQEGPTTKTVVNKHAIVQVEVEVKGSTTTSTTAVGPNVYDSKWSVILDEIGVSESDTTEGVRVVQRVDLIWSSGTTKRGMATLSFLVPASVSRTFILSLLEDQRLVTRRLANVYATTGTTWDGSRGSSPVVNVQLHGTTLPTLASHLAGSVTIVSRWVVILLLLFSVWICYALAVPSIMRSHKDHSQDVEDDEDDEDDTSDYLEQCFECDNDEITNDTGNDVSVSVTHSRQHKLPQPSVDSNDDESMLPPAVVRFKFDPSKFDQLDLHLLPGLARNEHEERTGCILATHSLISTPAREDQRNHRQLDPAETRLVPTPAHANRSPHLCATFQGMRKNDSAVCLPFAEPPLKSLTTCVDSGQKAIQVQPHSAETFQGERSSQPSEQCLLQIALEAVQAPLQNSSTQTHCLSFNEKIPLSANERASIEKESEIRPILGLRGDAPVVHDQSSNASVASSNKTLRAALVDQTTRTVDTIPYGQLGEMSFKVPETARPSHDQCKAVLNHSSCDSLIFAPFSRAQTLKNKSLSGVHQNFSLIDDAERCDVPDRYDPNLKNEKATISQSVMMHLEKTVSTSDGNPSEVDSSSLTWPSDHVGRAEESSHNSLPLISPVSVVTSRNRCEKSTMFLAVQSNDAPGDNEESDFNSSQRLSRSNAPVKRKAGLQAQQIDSPPNKLRVTVRPTLPAQTSAPSSQVGIVQLATLGSLERPSVVNERTAMKENWLLRLRSRSSKLQCKQHPFAATAPTSETKADDFSYVSTLPPDSETGSTSDMFNFPGNHKTPKTILDMVSPPFRVQSGKRKREYRGIGGRTRPLAGKVPVEVSTGSTTSLGPGDDDNNDVILWEPTAAERSCLPSRRNARRKVPGVSSAVPDTMPSVMLVATEVNAPVWEFSDTVSRSNRIKEAHKRTIPFPVDRLAREAREHGVPNSIKVLRSQRMGKRKIQTR